jgi:CHAT domain-containing protein
MKLDALVEQLLADRSAVQAILAQLSDAEITIVVERLKQEADRHWYINVSRSLELADIIVLIGQTCGDVRHTALGIMARGDALKHLGRMEEAWESLEQAGQLFQTVGDQIGWARTRIGRLTLGVDLNRVADALADATRARAIFTQHDEYEKRLRLDLNTGVVYYFLGDHQRALELHRAALATAESLGEIGQKYLGLLYTNIGLAYEGLSDFREALVFHERARAVFQHLDEIRGVGNAERNIAIITMTQGHYRRALDLLHRVLDRKVAEQLPFDAAYVKRTIVECYLLLNRYAEARDLAQQVIGEFRACHAGYEEALTLLHRATAEAELSDFNAAQASLDTAESLFASLGATTWVAMTRLWRGRIALQQGDPATAEQEAIDVAACFESNGQQVSFARAILLRGQALFVAGDTDTATQMGASALMIAQRCNVPALRYTSHLLLGHIAEGQGDLLRATQRYRAAAATVERVQRGLTITLRPGFLEDKGEALRSLISLYLRDGRAERAFENLERAKSQVLLGYLSNREQLRWAGDDDRSRALIADLNQLRAEHQWFYRLAHEHSLGKESRPGQLAPQQALLEVAARERRMRAITEQLYLHSGDSGAVGHAPLPSLADVQRSLSAGTLLVEFYNDGAHLWAFTLDAHTLAVHPLTTTLGALDRQLAQLQANLAFALNAGPDAPVAPGLANLAQRILQRLYTALLAPLDARLRDHDRLVIVPYGALHYLPFHLLHTGAGYLIEQFEIVVLPAAGLATRRGPVRAGGALVLAHSRDGQLPQTLTEAQIVQRLFGGSIYCDQAATRAALQAQPTRILHIAAHGEHRLDQPDLSYVQLADGQLYTDDLLQQDLSYELVTLSACETGQANVAAGDELVGLGRGFLYAGAGALIVSLWRVADDTAVLLMDHVYRALLAGTSKAAALRNAQRALHTANPQLHPAFWGAFQLIGDASPLSASPRSIVRKEHVDATLTVGS